MPTSPRFQFHSPPLSQVVKRLIITLLVAYVAQLLLENWMGLPISGVLALSPGQPWVWQLLTYVLVYPAEIDPFWFLFNLLMLWWTLSPFEVANGSKRTLQLCLVSVLGASVPADVLGFVLPFPLFPLFGSGALWLGSFSAFAWQNRHQRLSFFGLLSLTGLQMLLVLLAYSVLVFLKSKSIVGLIANLGAMAAALAFARWLERPPPRRPPRKPSARASGFKVIQGGGTDDDKPKWLN